MNGDVVLKQIIPVTLFFATSLVMSNKAYIYLSVSYIQVCPSDSGALQRLLTATL